MNNKQQTALQESIEYLNQRKDFLLDGGEPTNISAIDELENCIIYLESQLELESQQMIEFFVIGCNATYGYNMPSDNINYDKKQAEKYYNEKYGD